MTRALLLAGHGSHLNADSSAAVRAHTAELKRRGAFDEVHAVFWKEEPALCRALDVTDADDVTVVPVFISGGYFTEQVIPREMRLAGPLTSDAGRTIRYTRPIGAHPSLAQAIRLRAVEAGAGPQDTVVVLGHGTPRNPNSERNIYAQADALRSLCAFPEVGVAFIDQEPNVVDVFDLVRGNSIVMVPLFIADGWHVAETIPADLSMEKGRVCRGRRSLRYARAVGTHPAVADVVEELAREASAW